MVKLYNQISLYDTFLDCKDAYQNDKPKFLELLTNHLDLSSLTGLIIRISVEIESIP